ncbi:MAG: hypothetical protein WAV16_00550 [Candidatus Moraniibacteriota bacterium]
MLRSLGFIFLVVICFLVFLLGGALLLRAQMVEISTWADLCAEIKNILLGLRETFYSANGQK